MIMVEKNKKVKMSKVFLNRAEMTSEEAFHRLMLLRIKQRRKKKENISKK